MFIIPLMMPLLVLFGMLVMYAVVGAAWAVRTASGWFIGRYGLRAFLVAIGMMCLGVFIVLVAMGIAALPPGERMNAIESVPGLIVSLFFGRDPNSRFELLRVSSIAVVLVAGVPLGARIHARQQGLQVPAIARIGLTAILIMLATAVVGALIGGALMSVVQRWFGFAIARIALAVEFGVLVWLAAALLLPSVLKAWQGWSAENATIAARQIAIMTGRAIALMVLLREWIVVGMAAGIVLFVVADARGMNWWMRMITTRPKAE